MSPSPMGSLLPAMYSTQTFHFCIATTATKKPLVIYVLSPKTLRDIRHASIVINITQINSLVVVDSERNSLKQYAPPHAQPIQRSNDLATDIKPERL
jgi:hypothetical protein